MADNFDRLRHRPQMTDSVTLALDPNDAKRLLKAQAKANVAAERAAKHPADLHLRDEAAEAEAALAALRDEVVTFTVHLRGIGPRRVEELMLKFRPTPAQIKDARALNGGNSSADPQFDTDRLPPAVLAEAITSIVLSDDPDNPITDLGVEQVAELWTGRWSQQDKALIWGTAQALDQAAALVGDLGKG